MGIFGLLLLAEKDKQIISDIKYTHPELKDVDTITITNAYVEFLKGLGVEIESKN